jgi:hypothetical protein
MQTVEEFEDIEYLREKNYTLTLICYFQFQPYFLTVLFIFVIVLQFMKYSKYPRNAC